MDFSINKVHRAMAIKVFLYFNPDSYNRVTDDTPRYYLRPVKLLSVQRMGFTHKSAGEGYYKFGNKLYLGKQEEYLDDAGAEEIYDLLSNSYPYGYDENDAASIKKYNLDVKYDHAFQSYYRKYWEDNKDKIRTRLITQDGVYDQPHDYIEFEVLEPITNKHISGTAPMSDPTTELYTDYEVDQIYYADHSKGATSCTPRNVDVSYYDGEFYLLGRRKNYLTIKASGFITDADPLGTSGEGAFTYFDLTYPWELSTGSGAAPIETPFRIARTYEGVSGVSGEFSTEISGENITKFITPTLMNYLYVDILGKDSSHPHYGSGSDHGFYVDTGSAPPDTGLGYSFAPTLDLVRGGEYNFKFTTISGADHKIYISTDPSGGGNHETFNDHKLFVETTGISGKKSHLTSGTYAYTSGYSLMHSGITWRAPLNAPDTLYYNCENHAYMGGTINLVDPVSASGNIPGHTLALYADCGMYWDVGLSRHVNTGIFKPGNAVYYYTETTGHAGGIIEFVDICNDYSNDSDPFGDPDEW